MATAYEGGVFQTPVRQASPRAARMRALALRGAQLGWFLIFSLFTRYYVFGDTNFHEDELLFFTIGQRMHEGALPYVDVWDRKPPGLFLLYYLIAGISHAVLAYQLVAALFAALTAFVIALIAERLGWARGGLIAGSLYLATMLEFGGAGGQAAVFFNLFVAIAALLVIAKTPDLREGRVPVGVVVAMALAGTAITFKQTAVFEGAFLGLWAVWMLARAGTPRPRLAAIALALALAGALPMLAWGAFYAAEGHFAEFWHAMVTANLTKTYNPGGDLLHRARLFAVELAPLALLVLFGLLRAGKDAPARQARAFALGWLLAALVGFAVIPNLIDHYVLPVLVPLSLATAPILCRRPLGLLLGGGLGALYLSTVPVLDFQRGERSHAEMAALVERIQAIDPAPRLLVYDGPVYLYTLLGYRPVSPLAFPLHTSALPERDVSHLDTEAEFARMLAERPTTVVFHRHAKPPNLYNPVTRDAVQAYVRAHCRGQFSHQLHDMYGEVTLDVFTRCGGGK